MAINKTVEFKQSMPAEEIRRVVAKNIARLLPSLVLGKCSGPISVCGDGPSLRTLYPKDGPIAALNGAWRSLARVGITPDYIIAHDPNPENVVWFDDPPPNATYLLGSRMDPGVFDRLRKHNVQIWHLADSPEAGMKPRIGGGPTIGGHAINVLAAAGYEHFDLYGYDSCYALDGEHHATPQPWAKENPQLFQIGDRSFVASPWMLGQVESILEQVHYNKRDYTIKVMGDGFLAAALEQNTLDVVYDLDKAPGSFDFLHSLFNVEHFMDQEGYSRARVHFKAGSDQGFRPNEPIHVSHAGKTRMMNKVVRPLMQMFSIEEVADPGPDPKEFSYSPQEALYRYRRLGYMPQFTPNKEARRWARDKYGDHRPVVITLRECSYWPQRNSDVYEWVRFARSLPNTQRVVFLRDTDMVGHPFEFEVSDEASLNLHKRLALYQVASMNFFVMNGPAALAYYTQHVPYAVFLTSAPGYPCYSPTFLQRFLGIDPGGQFPWATPRQRLIYGDDDFELISKTYSELTR